MKWNTYNVSASIIVLCLGSFMLGKLTSGKAELIEDSKRLIQQRSHNASSDLTNRETTNRPKRPKRDVTSLDQKLVKMEQIVRGENVLERGRAMLEWLDKLTPEDFEIAVQRFEDLDLTGKRMGEYNMLLTAWAEVDPISAIAHTTTKNYLGGTLAGTGASTVLGVWADRDPEAAIAWAKANHEGDGANPHMIDIIRGLAESNPSLATSLLEEMPSSDYRSQALRAMVLKMGLETAQDCIARLSDAKLRKEAGAYFVQSMSKQDPAGAAAWLLANQETQSPSSFHHVFQEWSKRDIDAAMSSFEKLPEGINRSNALQGIILAEAAANPQAAAELMNRYSSELTDDTGEGFVYKTLNKSPELTVNQIGLIKNEQRRNLMYQHALTYWLESDRAAAQKWINSAKLPDSVIQSLGKPIWHDGVGHQP